MRPPTLEEIARHCGVTKATVSKALSSRPGACDLAPATRARIVEAAQALGYVPDARKSAQARRRFHRVGLLYGTRVPVFLGLFTGFAEELAEALAEVGSDLVFLPLVGGIKDWERAATDIRLDGLVVADPPPPHLERIIALARLPTVVVNQHLDLPVARVRPDDHDGARQLVEHLYARGYRRIIYVQTQHASGHPSLVDRLAGYRAGMAKFGLAPEALLNTPVEQARTLLAGQPPIGVVAYNCDDACTLFDALRACGAELPRQVAITGFDDIDTMRSRDLTCIRIPRGLMGREAARLVLERIAGRSNAATDEVVPVELVARGSTVPVKVL